MAYERIDESKTFDGPVRDEHELRYRIAAGHVRQDDTVLDIGCGVGYGEGLLKSIDYIGIDKNPKKDRHLKINLEEAGPHAVLDTIGREVDVAIALEIIEHLNDTGVRTLIKVAREAKKWAIISTPIVKNSNPYHKQQFTEKDILNLFLEIGDEKWRHYGTLKQDNDRYGIFIFKRFK